MAVTDSADMTISEDHLRALYSLLPGALRQNLYGPKFSKRLQVWRELLHPCGKTDIRKLDGFGGLTVKVNLGDRLGCDIYYGFFQENLDYSLFMALLKPQDVVIDIGANFGMYALGAAKQISSKGKVIAFEPDIRSMSLLKENVRLNDFEKVVTCIDVCIGNYDGEVSFFAAADPSFSGIHDTHRSEEMGRLTLPIRRIDSVLQEMGISQVNQIKIDVEGAEYEVLEGATEMLANSDAIVMLEISPKNLDADRSERLSEVLGKLEAQGYISFYIDQETYPAKLVIEGALKDLVQKTGAGQTKNYFLARRSKERIDHIQDAFKSMSLGVEVKQKEVLDGRQNLFTTLHEEGGCLPVLVQGETTPRELGNPQAVRWAEGVERQAIIDSYRQMQTQFRELELKFAKIGEEMLAQKGENAAIKASLTKLTLDYRSSLNEESGCLPPRPAESEVGDLENLCHELRANAQVANDLYQNACIQVEVLQSKIGDLNEALAARTKEKAEFKAKLVETSKKLVEANKEFSALTNGFLGLFFRIKRRWLNRGATHG